MECYSAFRTKDTSTCVPHLEDYMECLHHTKEVGISLVQSLVGSSVFRSCNDVLFVCFRVSKHSSNTNSEPMLSESLLKLATVKRVF